MSFIETDKRHPLLLVMCVCVCAEVVCAVRAANAVVGRLRRLLSPICLPAARARRHIRTPGKRSIYHNFVITCAAQPGERSR